jgi:hypothetical protein
MLIRLISAALLLACLSGCRAVDGTWLPGCAAYAGDRLEFHGSAFTWDKFTDAVEVDEAGNPVDPFPGYPKTGTFDTDGNRIVLSFDDGSESQVLHLQRSRGKLELYTDTQLAEWKKSNSYPDCVLTHVGNNG